MLHLSLKKNILINRNFALLWVGSIVSRLGDVLFDTTLILWIVTQLARGKDWAALAVSGAVIAEFIPIFVVGPLAGTLIDHWQEKRGVMLRMDAIRAVLLIVLVIGMIFFSYSSGTVSSPFVLLACIYLVVLCISTCTRFFIQASNVIYRDILDDEDRARGSGLLQTITGVTSIAGPPLATLLFFTLGPVWSLLLDAISFLVSFGCILLIRVPALTEEGEAKPQQQISIFQQWKEGLQFFGKSTVLMTIVVSFAFISLWNSVFATLGIFFLSQNIHAPVSYYGFWGTAEGIGFALGSFLAGMYARRFHESRVFWSSMIAMGLLILIYARMTAFIPSLIAVALLGMLVAAANVAVFPLVIHETPRSFLGRVTSTLGSTLTCIRIIASAVAGWFVSALLQNVHIQFLGVQFGAVDVVFSVIGLLLLVAGLFAMRKLPDITQEQETKEVPQRERAEESSVS